MVKTKKTTTTTVVTEEIIGDGGTVLKPLKVYVLIDASGSMESIRQQTVTSINEYFNTLKGKDGTVTLAIFDSGHYGELRYKVLRENQHISKLKHLGTHEYVPNGGTPLYDSIARMITDIDRETASGDYNIAMVILTDGYNNSSKEHADPSTIKAWLENRKAMKNWLVLYLGANQDAFVAGSAFGNQYQHTANYNTQFMNATLRAAGAATMRYAATADLTASAFNDLERQSMMKGDEADAQK